MQNVCWQKITSHCRWLIPTQMHWGDLSNSACSDNLPNFNHIRPLPTFYLPVSFHRVAMMVADYNDYCRCDAVPNGITALSMRLLEKAGFKVLFVPHTKFRSSESILTRAKYLDEQLKAIIAEQNWNNGRAGWLHVHFAGTLDSSKNTSFDKEALPWGFCLGTILRRLHFFAEC